MINVKILGTDELNGLLDDVIAEIKHRKYHEGFDDGIRKGHIAEPYRVAPISGQQLRDQIVEKAKRDVTDLEQDFFGKKKYQVDVYMCDVDFVVNREKRTVVSLMVYRVDGYAKTTVITKGIAKCAPTDCFNVHIGKAIALRRALGLEVPAEYLKAPQPTEVQVGDVVKMVNSLGNDYVRTVKKLEGSTVRYEENDGFDFMDYVFSSGTIIDDSRVDAEQV
jgi:hypothetical protein